MAVAAAIRATTTTTRKIQHQLARDESVESNRLVFDWSLLRNGWSVGVKLVSCFPLTLPLPGLQYCGGGGGGGIASWMDLTREHIDSCNSIAPGELVR